SVTSCTVMEFKGTLPAADHLTMQRMVKIPSPCRKCRGMCRCNISSKASEKERKREENGLVPVKVCN
ncbi:hypothetical protein A2U01_0046860, partial [Trifolium medium]|nr:hypothetical protein [Trifolium medium]